MHVNWTLGPFNFTFDCKQSITLCFSRFTSLQFIILVEHMFFQIHIFNFTKPKPTLSNFEGLKFEKIFTSFNKKFLKKRYFFYWQKFPKKLSIYHQYLDLLCIKHLLKDFCRKYSRKYTKPTLSFPLKTKLFIVRHLYPKINFRNLQSAASLL